MCIRQTGAKVIGFQFRIVGQNGFVRFPLCEQAKDEFDGNPQPANDRLATENLGVGTDSSKQFFVNHVNANHTPVHRLVTTSFFPFTIYDSRDLEIGVRPAILRRSAAIRFPRIHQLPRSVLSIRDLRIDVV